MRNTVRFDWALKRLLRNKTNYGILEGFLSELLADDIKIEKILDSESNKQTFDNKLNRVDMLVQNSKLEIIIIEFQTNYMSDYLTRMLYGTSKIIIDFMDMGMNYAQVKKIISINIVFFDLGHGLDYIYHGTTNFVGLNKHDILNLSTNEQKVYLTPVIAKVYPEYYIIKVNQFNEHAKNTVDEWINFLKTEEVSENTIAKGLKQARETLDLLKLTKEEQLDYYRDMNAFRDYESGMTSNYSLGEEKGIKIGEEKERIKGEEKLKYSLKQKQIETAKKCLKKGMSMDEIIDLTELTEQEIIELI